MASSHSRKVPSRAALPRRTTKGPLDVDDAASSSITSLSSLSSRTPDPVIRSVETPQQQQGLSSAQPTSDRADDNAAAPVQAAKDFSFLFDTTIYHPLGQIEIPAPFRKPFPPPPAPGTTFRQISIQLEQVLGECNFIGAAHLAALALTSRIVLPHDFQSIFRLLAIRYSALELSGHVLLAAQEAKALEDLSSTFYYHDDIQSQNSGGASRDERPLPSHIMPFDLRLQVLRLQSIGFSDPRRGVTALYDLGLECREHLASPRTTSNETQIWTSRLEEVGIRVVNALIDMGDLECASRTLQSMKPMESVSTIQWTTRLLLLHIKMGKTEQSQALLRSATIGDGDKKVLDSLLAVADGRYEDALRALSTKTDEQVDDALTAIVKQNLAVAYLYTGQVSECRTILQELVDEHQSFQALTTNLATVFELTSDKARDLKMSLATTIANEHDSISRAYVNVDFKL